MIASWRRTRLGAGKWPDLTCFGALRVTFSSSGGIERDWAFDNASFAMDDVDISRVPLPGTLALGLAGLGMILTGRRYRQC